MCFGSIVSNKSMKMKRKSVALGAFRNNTVQFPVSMRESSHRGDEGLAIFSDEDLFLGYTILSLNLL